MRPQYKYTVAIQMFWKRKMTPFENKIIPPTNKIINFRYLKNAIDFKMILSVVCD